MRVLLDGRVNGADGIGRYTRSVVRALTGLDQGIDIRVLDPTGTGRYARTEGAELVAYARSCGADIVHLLDYRVPVAPIATISMIITVHDVLRLVQPGFCYSDWEFEARFGTQSFSDLTAVVGDLRDVTTFPGRQAPAGRHEEFLGRMLAFAVDQSHAVITPTTTVAHQLCDIIPTAQGKVRVSPWGIDHLPAATDTVPIALLRPYVLYVGQARGHKGLPVLLKAVARSAAYRDGVDLILVGRDFTSEGTAATAAKEILGEHRVHPMGEVSDDMLAALYTQATALLHLAEHEGFGFPPLEALAHGCPVVASDIPVLRETLLSYYRSVLHGR